MPELESPIWELPFASPALLTPAFLGNALPVDSSPFVVIPEN